VPKSPEKVNSIGELEAYINELVEFGIPPGMTLVVVKNDSIIYNKGFGWADKPNNIRASSNSIYHWWSCTKIITAAAILQLQEKNLLSVNDPVIKHLSFFDVKYPSENCDIITIKHLLNHSSGLPDPGFNVMSWIHHENDKPFNQTKFLKTVLPEFSELQFEPGSYTSYTNIGYMVLGAIIENVTNQSYENYIRENILLPLGMNHTAFLYADSLKENEAAGSHPLFDLWTPLVPFIAGSYVREISGDHLWFKRIYTDQTPPTGLIGTATDAAKFVITYLNGGKTNGSRILSEESIHYMTTEDHINAKENNPDYYIRQGIGWQVFEEGGKILQHEGGGFGFYTIIKVHTDKNLGFVLFTNDFKCEGWRIINLADQIEW
jgi:CubicO group peptidase (beta-lactamase class C family)